jgi:hypothetical protein
MEFRLFFYPRRLDGRHECQENIPELRADASTEVAGGALVAKEGAGAVLAGAAEKGAPPVFAIAPGVMLDGELARLVDRGYQKFLKSAHRELPATAVHLHLIHRFSEELKYLTGAADLYNQSLGSISDLYRYDRLRGRDAAATS